MATTRFGGVSPTHSYATKVRWLVVGLLALILILLFVVIYIAQFDPGEAESAENTGASGTEQAAVNPEPIGSSVDIVVTAQRIEKGTMLQGYMFRKKPWEADQLPEGAVVWQEIDAISGKFAGDLINANIPLTRDKITTERPLSAIPIPPGYRAVTIEVDRRSGVEGFARPNTRVDILFTYTAGDGSKQVATIVRFCKVLSVGGQTANAEQAQKGNVPIEAKTTVSLLVTEKDAKKIELARTIGSLTLSLVGTEDTLEGREDPETVDIYDLLGTPRPEEEVIAEEESYDGVMYSQDPKTGKTRRYVLKGGKWRLDQGYSADDSGE